MGCDGTGFASIAETTSFLHHFNGLPDHRQAGKVDYPLPEVLLLILLAVLAGAEAFTDIARFGERKIDLLRRFRPYVNGTPSHDHLGDIFATLDARAFQLCFVAWVAALTNTPAEVIAVDGKTSRRSYQKKGSKEAIHIVSAFAARQRIVLGQVMVNEKSNEIVAIPALLDMMSIQYIPRSRHNPKILWIDDAEVVGDRIAESRPIPGNSFTQEPKRRIGELGASRVGFIVRDMLVHHAP